MKVLRGANVTSHPNKIKNERLVTKVRKGIDSCEVTNLPKIK